MVGREWKRSKVGKYKGKAKKTKKDKMTVGKKEKKNKKNTEMEKINENS